jgi:hypothetical protein
MVLLEGAGGGSAGSAAGGSVTISNSDQRGALHKLATSFSGLQLEPGNSLKDQQAQDQDALDPQASEPPATRDNLSGRSRSSPGTISDHGNHAGSQLQQVPNTAVPAGNGDPVTAIMQATQHPSGGLNAFSPQDPDALAAALAGAHALAAAKAAVAAAEAAVAVAQRGPGAAAALASLQQQQQRDGVPGASQNPSSSSAGTAAAASMMQGTQVTVNVSGAAGAGVGHQAAGPAPQVITMQVCGGHSREEAPQSLNKVKSVQ